MHSNSLRVSLPLVSPDNLDRSLNCRSLPLSNSLLDRFGSNDKADPSWHDSSTSKAFCTSIKYSDPPLSPPCCSGIMFKRVPSIFLVATTLLLFSSAYPNPKPRSGATIPLPKRSGLTRADGVFDYEKAVYSIAGTKNKHRQNLINLERNRGKDAFAEVSFAFALSSTVMTHFTLGCRNQAHCYSTVHSRFFPFSVCS
jgi:hypothetical protein